MEHVSSVRLTGKFPEKVENRKRWSRFPGWNFRTECRVPLTFLVVCTSSRSTVGHPATYRGLRPNGATFYRSEIPLLLPPKFPVFFRKWKAPIILHTSSQAIYQLYNLLKLPWHIKYPRKRKLSVLGRKLKKKTFTALQTCCRRAYRPKSHPKSRFHSRAAGQFLGDQISCPTYQ